MQQRIHVCPDFELQCGATLRPARLSYVTHGELSAARDNAVLFPTWFSSTHAQNAWLMGDGRALDPRRHFIICADLLGNGLSSSPSNTPPPHDRARFPRVSVLDNVTLQHDLVTRALGLERLRLVVGRSMGAQVAFQWGCAYPDMVEAILPFTGSARTTPHNYVFLDGVKAALKTDQAWQGGDYASPPLAGLKTVGRLYAGWALSQAFYRQGLHLAGGAADLDDYLARSWEPNFTARDANNLLSQIDTWQHADISANAMFNGDWPMALSAIKARAIVMPCRTDLYFPPEDSAAAVRHMPHAELRVIESVWGHRGGGPGSPPEDIAAVEQAIRELLAQ